MPHVPHALRALVPHVPLAPSSLVPHVPHSLRALVLHVNCALRALVSYLPHALRALVPHLPHALRALMSVKKVFLEFRKIHRKTPVPESLFNKVAGLRPATLLKKRLWHRCFPVNFAKFLRTPFLTKHLQWLLLTFDSQKHSCNNQLDLLDFSNSGLIAKRKSGDKAIKSFDRGSN